MSLARVNTECFRNLSPGVIELSASLNIILGENGSGKSSLLEAIFLLGHGKSFRTTRYKDIANLNKTYFVVSGKTSSDTNLGTKRDVEAGTSIYKVNGFKQEKLSEFVKNLAIQIVTPESFKLFFGGPKERRKFLDLGLFHVEQSFSSQWKAFKKILEQRNACLKNGIKGREFSYWTDAFCEYSDILSELRLRYVNMLVQEVNHWTGIINVLGLDDAEVSIELYKGWSTKKDIRDVLNTNVEKEYAFKHSLSGAHKFDLKFLINKRPIESLLSRGQQKLFLLVLTLAQTSLIKKVKQIKPILLIDDVGAELDEQSRSLLANAIAVLNCQVVMTAIDRNAIEPLVQANKNYKMFHVKHGNVSEISEY